MSNVNQHLTPDDLDRIPFPLEAGYRIVSRPAENAVVIAPRKVGALYTDDDFEKLAAYGKSFGFAVLRYGGERGYAYILGPLTRPDAWIAAFLSDGDYIDDLIYLWPDGTWCREEDLEEHLSFLSDDFEVRQVLAYDEHDNPCHTRRRCTAERERQ